MADAKQESSSSELTLKNVRERLDGRNLVFFFVCHEFLGISYAISLIALCYKGRPTARLLQTEGGRKVVERVRKRFEGRSWGLGGSKTWEGLKEKTYQGSKKMSDIFPERYRPEPKRLMVAAGEQVILRRCLTPVSVPGKILLSWWAVCALPKWLGGGKKESS